MNADERRWIFEWIKLGHEPAHQFKVVQKISAFIGVYRRIQAVASPRDKMDL
jgi:hypothetical protein